MSDFDVRSTYQMGWHELINGALIDIAIVVLQTNHGPTIERALSKVTLAIAELPDGGFAEVAFARSKLMRRRYAPRLSRNS